MTEPEPAPDISQPVSFGEVFRSLTPGGTDGDALMKALKASRRAPIPMTAPPAPADPELIWCRACSRPHGRTQICPDAVDKATDPARHECKPGCLGGPAGTTCHSCGGPDAIDPEGHREGCEYARLETGRREQKQAADRSLFPADPFTPGAMADTATAEWYHGMLGAGIPLASAERIIGAMFAGIVLGREARDG